jgi:hypothetical protein
MLVDRTGVVYVKTVALQQARPGEPLAPRAEAFIRIVEGVVVDRVEAPKLPDVSLPMVAMVDRTGRTIGTYFVPYSPRAVWKLSPEGYFVTALTNRYAVDLRIGKGAVEARSAPGRAGVGAGNLPMWRPGDIVLSIRRDVSSIPLSRQERSDQLARLRARTPEGGRHTRIAELPRTKPPIRWIEVGADGTIWVQSAGESERVDPVQNDGRVRQVAWREPNVWDVFEPDGGYVGAVAIPDSVQVILRTRDVAWGVFRNVFDVPFLTRYRIGWQ